MDRNKKIIIGTLVILLVAAVVGVWTYVDAQEKNYEETVSSVEKYYDKFVADVKVIAGESGDISFEHLSKEYMVFARHANTWNNLLQKQAENGSPEELTLSNQCVDFREGAQAVYFDIVHMYYIGDKEKDDKKVLENINNLEELRVQILEGEAAL